ncbi:Haemolysin-type calcium binding protein related domain protein [Roseibium album]|nr:Haemolysin-type calcium binding protein related domain protein [Roseibium album]
MNLGWNSSGSSGEIRLADQAQGIELFVFDDGQMLRSISLINNDLLKLVGTSKNDVITGTEFRSKIYGRSGDDFLDAGQASVSWQYLFGESGDDTYYYSKHSGKVFVEETSGNDLVKLLDLSLLDLVISTTNYGPNRSWGTTLNLGWNSSGSSGEIRLADLARDIELFVFDDGQMLRSISLINNDLLKLVGTSKNDVITGTEFRSKIYGRSGDDFLDAGQASESWQYLFGDSGNDTFLFSTSNGKVFIDDSSGTNDILRFTDLDRVDVTLSSTDYGNHSWGETLNLSWDSGGNSGQVRVANLGNEIEQFVFSDGSIFSADEFII